MTNDKRWVRLLTKAPVDLPNDTKELFEYYCKQKGFIEFPLPCTCYCSQKEVSDIVAAFVVDAYGESRNLYLTYISLDCLKKRIKAPQNPITFQIPIDRLLFISKYDPSSDFIDINTKNF